MLFLCVAHTQGWASQISKQYYFQTYDIRNGLSHNTVHTILQDKLGFMWIGTKDGLNRFDGITFRVFNKENSNLDNNYITRLLQDKNGLLWIGTDAGIYIYNPLFDRFYTIKEFCNFHKEISNAITEIKEDQQHNIWFSVDYEGLYKFDITNKNLSQPIKTASSGLLSNNISDFWFRGNTYWIALYGKNLYYSNDNFKTLHPYKDKDGKMTFTDNIIHQVYVKGSISYLCTSKGLFELNLTNGSNRKLLSCYARTLNFRSDNELWAGTEQGLYIYNLSTGAVNHIVATDNYDPYSLTDNAIYTIYRDKDEGMWIGSYFGGLNYCPYPWSYFEKFYPKDNLKVLGRRIREFCRSNDGTIWIGTEDKGLFNFNPQTKNIIPFSNPKIYSNVHGLCMDGNYLWVGTSSGGLNRIDLRTKQVRNYRLGDNSTSLISNDIFSIYRTKSGDLWIGTVSGLQRYNRQTDSFTQIPRFTNKFIYNILEADNGDLWLATYANGVYRYNIHTKRWNNYVTNSQNTSSLPYNKVISIFQDSKGRLWFMTQGGGFCKYNPRTDNFTRYSMADGFPSNIVYKMVEDNTGNLWLSTNKGLVCYNPDTNFRKIYTTSDGLLSNQFNYQSGMKDRDGTIYLGSINGFIGFNPTTLKGNPKPSPIYLTELYIFNQHVTVGGKDSPLKRSLLFSDKIELSAKENSIALQTACLNFQSSEKKRLMYKLEGFDKSWHVINGSDMIYYSNLPYDTYRLIIRGMNNEGKWDGKEDSLQIHVRPPFYLSGWAYTFYLLLFLSLSTYIIYYFRHKMITKHKRALKQFEQEKERELYNAKINFFTNITHEIRTPLTLIKGPLEMILSSPQDISQKIKDNLKVINQNTDRLLTLVNQLLDFRKAEKEGLKLNFVSVNVSLLLEKISASFAPILKQRRICFTTEVTESIIASVDIEAFTKIISNLLSNASKHAQNYVTLKAGVHGNRLIVTVANDGDVIPLSRREKIFQPFIQLSNMNTRSYSGTGLGLTLSRELANLHHGSLKMDTSETQNCFILNLPLTQENEINIPISDDDNNAIKHEQKDNNFEYTLLIVEDNKEMLSFIVNILMPYYKILTAENGKQAIEVLKGNTINLIISDIMMPEMDGFELCGWVKTTFDYSHIPVILLTAKTALSAKIEGTKHGAEAYIEKPFSIEYLKAEIINLLKSRENLRKIFIQAPFTQTNSVTLSKTDQDFMTKVHDIVAEHLQEADFSLEDLAKELMMSRSSLGRKFRGLINMTPNDYIQIERLKRAAQMLKDGETRINEVCWRCGFNTPSYFTKCFKKQFGVLPKDFILKYK